MPGEFAVKIVERAGADGDYVIDRGRRVVEYLYDGNPITLAALSAEAGHVLSVLSDFPISDEGEDA